MDLIEILQTLIQNGVEELKLTDLIIGTIMSVVPYSVTINQYMMPIPQEALIFTSAVMPKTYSGTTSDGASFTVVINEGLQVMDKVIMLRVQHGQRFIILSKVQN